MDSLFQYANLLALFGWLLLLFAPNRNVTRYLVHLGGIPALLALTYVVIVAMNVPFAEGGFGSLAAVTQLFGNEQMLMAGWLHYLCFDLLIGAAIVRRARRDDISRWRVIPCLSLTFMFGPAGWLCYLVLSRQPWSDVTCFRRS